MRVLLVEDELRLARSYQRNLERDGYIVELLADGETAYRRLSANHESVDIVVLDVLLPGISGIELCRVLRRDGIRTPILLLTALDQTADKVAGLDAGADDYLTKPFPFEELLARLRALGRRPHIYDPVAKATQIQVGDLVIDELLHEVYLGSRLIPLTPREFTLLAYLARHPNRVLTREQLLSHVWPDGTEVSSNVLDTYIHHLRDKLEGRGDARLLQTVRGVGYALRTPKAGSPR